VNFGKLSYFGTLLSLMALKTEFECSVLRIIDFQNFSVVGNKFEKLVLRLSF